MNGTGSIFTKRQWMRALQMIGIKNDTLAREILYSEWVDLFRYKQTLKKSGEGIERYTIITGCHQGPTGLLWHLFYSLKEC